MHIIVIVVNDIIVILKHISKLGTRKRLLNTKIEPNFEGSKKLNVEDGTVLDFFHAHRVLFAVLRTCQQNLLAIRSLPYRNPLEP